MTCRMNDCAASRPLSDERNGVQPLPASTAILALAQRKSSPVQQLTLSDGPYKVLYVEPVSLRCVWPAL